MEAAAADGDPYVPIYISSDEEDGQAHAYFAQSYSPEEIEIQEAILLSLDPSRAPAATATASSSAPPSSSRPTGVSNPREPPPDRKGKRQISSEDGPRGRRKKRSKRSRFNCAICFEMVEVSEKFVVSHCAHAFCNSCVGRYVAGKIAENVAVVGCPDPGCEEGVVEMDLCRDIVPPELFDRWNVALCENMLGDDKLYCPFKDCSALLINDATVKIRETECPHCHRLFCARCRVPWHDGIKCKAFRNLGDDEKGEDDLMLKKLADKKKWQRCPKCKMYVSRRSGCLLIKCRCKQYFCYHCAAPMDKNIHFCNNCKS
ncbi:probable E3 ubiquitin-protein ligase RNF144A-B [Panicum virgatum]|uniref:RBR-type E3 ubiquitin transferase n=1 Tax=Panicum virgatum TaxID=38727 RepID=A0A8T0VE53_PANVG|nr:probable E3 ubiquitin-protein ligase RNF144A-B [Panicum virgatum]KAG2635081.1 hypothetical protein PVAP13_2NG335400 [Panicum virgatum]